MMTHSESLIRQFQCERVRLLAYIRSLVGDPDLTEDIFQEVSVIVLQKAQNFDATRDLQAWCRGIARNFIKRERSRSRRVKLFDNDQMIDLVTTAFDENPDLELLNTRRANLKQCADTLAPTSKQLVELRYMSGISIRSIAEKLGRTEQAVQVALSRIRKTITECVERRQKSEVEPSV